MRKRRRGFYILPRKIDTGEFLTQNRSDTGINLIFTIVHTYTLLAISSNFSSNSLMVWYILMFAGLP